jgi:hypothetical protein
MNKPCSGEKSMQESEKTTKSADEEYIDYKERNKLLWSLRSEFAWEGKQVPERVEIGGQEYNLRSLVQELQEKKPVDPNRAAEIRLLIPKLRKKAKDDEEILETEKLTKTEAEALYEEATGLLRAAMELEDILEGKGGEKSADELKKMIKTQKLLDEKSFQKFLKDLK